MITSGQIRAARGLSGISQAKLAEMIGVSTMTIKRAEGTVNPMPSTETIGKIQSALESAGIEFIPENGGGAGVRLKK